MSKKLTAIVLLIVISISFANCGVKKEDIKTTTLTNVITAINYYPIKSHMIDNKFYVEIDELKNYGFDVKLSNNVYTITETENKVTPKFSGKLYTDKELKGEGKPYKKSNLKAQYNNVKNAEIYEVDGKACMLFSVLTDGARGVEDRKDVKNILNTNLKYMGSKNEYILLKLRSNIYNVEDFFQLTIEDLKKVYSNGYKEEKAYDYTLVTFNDCPCEVYFDYSEKDTEEDKNNKKVKKVYTNNASFSYMNDKLIGKDISYLETKLENKLNVRDSENPPYAVYKYYKNYNIKFIFNNENKVVALEVEKK